MSRLAICGGTPVLQSPLNANHYWPPVSQEMAEQIKSLYLSGKWSAFDGQEQTFCDAFARHHGAEYGVFMANGTVTLQCALAAFGIGPGDEVIVPALTWIATAMAVHYVGATPVFVDIEPDTLCMDPDKVAAAVTDRTKAIIPAHLYASMADMEKIMQIATSHDLKVIEDCAHMHGGFWNGKGAGTLGHVGSFSFQQSKTMASGEGGLCLTSDPAIADDLFRLSHIGYGLGVGQGLATDTPRPGLVCHNFRATSFQAAVLMDQLESLEARLTRYQQAIDTLEKRLSQTTKIRFQKPGRNATFQGCYSWVMIFDHPEYADIPLDTLQKALCAEGISTEGLGIRPTWGPVYQHKLFNLDKDAYRIDQEQCPVTEAISNRSLLIMHSLLAMEDDKLKCLAEIIEKVMHRCDDLLAQAQQQTSGRIVR